MKTIFTICILLTSIFPLRADWFEIDATQKVIAFSKLARVGKVSVFIISTSYCIPCKVLKERLKSEYTGMDKDRIDFYYVVIDRNSSDLINRRYRPAYKVWRNVERITSLFPSVIITSPATNIVAFISGPDYEKITETINFQVQSLDIYDFHSLVFTGVNNECCLSLANHRCPKPKTVIIRDTIVVMKYVQPVEPIPTIYNTTGKPEPEDTIASVNYPNKINSINEIDFRINKNWFLNNRVVLITDNSYPKIIAKSPHLLRLTFAGKHELSEASKRKITESKFFKRVNLYMLADYRTIVEIRISYNFILERAKLRLGKGISIKFSKAKSNQKPKLK